MKFDMHVHTRYSARCGYMTPKKLSEIAIDNGLDGLAITDHNTIEGALELVDLVKDEQISLAVIVGEEITTDRGEVLAYFIKSAITAGPFEEVMGEIKLAGGVSAIPHPFDRIRGGFKGLEEVIRDIDAIEVLNSRCIFNRDALDFCVSHKKKMLGGSDAHFYSEVGRAWTEFTEGTRKCLLEEQAQVGGGLSNPVYLALTKGLKMWRKANSN
ncbi:MAG: PHP domain-containing protein [Methanothrix sp.]